MDLKELQNIKQRYNIVGNCDALNHALDVAMQVAATDLSVLIIGESGVGKEIIPRVIHDSSPRKREKYFAINCGSIPEGTIDSELFGHEKGSFTGAIGESEGYFGAANKGTLFLDEVGELPMATQARLLRVLETGEYIRVGGQEIRKTNVRIVAATNVNIRKAISEGRFREDLYYRLNTIPIQMPPLRDRGEDIVLLFRLFAMQMSEKYRLPRITLTDSAKQLLMQYKWPGNVRQLKNITEQMSVLSTKRELDAEDLLNFIPMNEDSTQLATIQPQNGGSRTYESEREMLFKILYEMRSNVTDLRHEITNLRQQLNDAQQTMPQMQNMPVAQGYQNGNMRGMADAYAQEISEPESLNITDWNRKSLEMALERAGGNRKKAAKMMGISDRTLYRRLKEFGLGVMLLFITMMGCYTLTSCSVSYKFNGASIDYSKTKTITIADFPLRTTYVWGPMASIFNNQLKDQFAQQTKLIQVKRDGDLKIEGEITQYQQRNKSVSSEGYSAQTELIMTVNVRFTNTKNHDEDFEQQFTATQTYDTSQSLSSVQEELVTQMSKDLCDQIFNATVANW